VKFIVLARDEIERGVLVREPYVVISISDPGTKKPRIRQPPLCRGILSLRFHDAEPIDDFKLLPDIKLMTPNHAKRIWRFILEHSDAIQIAVVHCEQGMSRSPAVAAALCRLLGGNDSRFFQNYAPNRFAYELVLRAGGLQDI